MPKRALNEEDEERKLSYLKAVRLAEVDGENPPELYLDFVRFLDADPKRAAHYYRYCQTFRAMVPYLDQVPGLHVLETGSFCPITQFLETRGGKCRKTNSDLRYKIDAPDSSADLILSLEVIEHLKDQTETELSEIVLFRGTGTRAYASEIFRVLRPGGLLVLTTPNPCSAVALNRLLAGRAPMVFRSHVREYTRDELVTIFAGFEIVLEATQYAFFMLAKHMRTPWMEMFERNNWDADGRGDDHLIIFRKPRS